MTKSNKNLQLKDIFFNEDFIISLSNKISTQYSSFDNKKFKNKLLDDNWNSLELKARVNKIALVMGEFMPYSYEKNLDIIINIAPNFTGFSGVILPEFIAIYGFERKDEDRSINALKYLTKYSTSEFAIRKFIKREPEKILSLFETEFAKDNCHHVRRLSSEASRMMLPWAEKIDFLIENPQKIIKILTILQQDNSLYVRKSVANNLNDIGKKHKELLINIAYDWYGKNNYSNWIIKKGCRNLLKQGEPRILKLFNFDQDNLEIKVNEFALSKQTLSIGDDVFIKADLLINNLSEKNIKIKLEYLIEFASKNNNVKRNKIFRIAEKELLAKSDTKIAFNKKHSFANLTTRRHYSGKQIISLMVNNKILAINEVELRG